MCEFRRNLVLVPVLLASMAFAPAEGTLAQCTQAPAAAAPTPTPAPAPAAAPAPTPAPKPDQKAAGKADSAMAAIKYGQPLMINRARTIVDRARGKAIELIKPETRGVAIAIVDVAGKLVLFERLDGTAQSAVDLSIAKAIAAVEFGRDTGEQQTDLTASTAGLRLLKTNAFPIAGGLPLMEGGCVVGAIGVAGRPDPDNIAIAKAGVGP